MGESIIPLCLVFASFPTWKDLAESRPFDSNLKRVCVLGEWMLPMILLKQQTPFSFSRGPGNCSLYGKRVGAGRGSCKDSTASTGCIASAGLDRVIQSGRS